MGRLVTLNFPTRHRRRRDNPAFSSSQRRCKTHICPQAIPRTGQGRAAIILMQTSQLVTTRMLPEFARVLDSRNERAKKKKKKKARAPYGRKERAPAALCEQKPTNNHLTRLITRPAIRNRRPSEQPTAAKQSHSGCCGKSLGRTKEAEPPSEQHASGRCHATRSHR